MDFRPDPIYEFPPFFTRQPNEDTWKAQLEQWQRVVRAFCTHAQSWEISPANDLFTNKRIQRGVRPAMAQQILESMVKQGQAETMKNGITYIYKQSPVELATQLRKWADSTGHGGSVLTFYELTEGELPGLPEFVNLDIFLLKRVVEVMAKRGEAALIREDGEVVGVKLADL